MGTLMIIFATAFIVTGCAYRRKSLEVTELKEIKERISWTARLHRPVEHSKRGKSLKTCNECNGEKWPCETLRALDPTAGRPDVSKVMTITRDYR